MRRAYDNDDYDIDGNANNHADDGDDDDADDNDDDGDDDDVLMKSLLFR